MDLNLELPPWGYRFLSPARYKTAYGGRSSTKTHTFGRLLLALGWYQPLRIACVREFQQSIRESVKSTLDELIQENEVFEDHYTSRNQWIESKNGTYIFFQGLERRRDSIYGLEGVNILWGEQAERISHRTATVLVPTMREPGSQMWFSWNPMQRSDWIYQRFVEHPEQGDMIQFVTYRDNPWFSAESERDRQYDLRNKSEAEYRHIWDGEPDDEGLERKVLSYSDLAACVQAYRDGHASGLMLPSPESGLDVADSPAGDENALARRQGPVLWEARKWYARNTDETAAIADEDATQHGVEYLHYDAIGVGAGVKAAFDRYVGRVGGRYYAVRPEAFGGAVKGKLTQFVTGRTNEQQFALRNAQLGWALRMRVTNTMRLLSGDTGVNPLDCLFIYPGIADLNTLLVQMSQPAWRTNETNGKIELAKRDEDEQSPDLYDAVVLAFARDSEYGLSEPFRA